MRPLEEFYKLIPISESPSLRPPLHTDEQLLPCSKLDCFFAPDDVVFLLLSPQYGRAFLSGSTLLLMDVAMEMEPCRSTEAAHIVKTSLSEVQMFLQVILHSPLPQQGHCQHCPAPCSLLQSQMGQPSHFGTQAS